MQLFYAPNITPPSHILDEEESKHCVRVLRLKNGDTLHITDGRGNLFRCRVVADNPKRCEVRVEQTIEHYAQLPYRLTMAVAPTKNSDRYEWFLEKAVEIGVSDIYPLLTAHSERRKLNMERSEKILISAMKQSVKATLPTLHQPTSFADFVKGCSSQQRFIAHCEEQEKLYLADRVGCGADVAVMIGPEGDFSPEEIALAAECGFEGVSLGESRLRTETAAVMAVAILSVKNNQSKTK